LRSLVHFLPNPHAPDVSFEIGREWNTLPLQQRVDRRIPAFRLHPCGGVYGQARVFPNVGTSAAPWLVFVNLPAPLTCEIQLRKQRKPERQSSDGQENGLGKNRQLSQTTGTGIDEHQ